MRLTIRSRKNEQGYSPAQEESQRQPQLSFVPVQAPMLAGEIERIKRYGKPENPTGFPDLKGSRCETRAKNQQTAIDSHASRAYRQGVAPDRRATIAPLMAHGSQYGIERRPSE